MNGGCIVIFKEKLSKLRYRVFPEMLIVISPGNTTHSMLTRKLDDMPNGMLFTLKSIMNLASYFKVNFMFFLPLPGNADII
jgi:hypothetical protein